MTINLKNFSGAEPRNLDRDLARLNGWAKALDQGIPNAAGNVFSKGVGRLLDNALPGTVPSPLKDMVGVAAHSAASQAVERAFEPTGKPDSVGGFFGRLAGGFLGGLKEVPVIGNIIGGLTDVFGGIKDTVGAATGKFGPTQSASVENGAQDKAGGIFRGIQRYLKGGADIVLGAAPLVGLVNPAAGAVMAGGGALAKSVLDGVSSLTGSADARFGAQPF